MSPLSSKQVRAGNVSRTAAQPCLSLPSWKTNHEHNSLQTQIPNPAPEDNRIRRRRRPTIHSPTANPPSSDAQPDLASTCPALPLLSRAARSAPPAAASTGAAARDRGRARVQPWRARICCGGRSSTPPSSIQLKVTPLFITRKALKDGDADFAPKLAKCGIFS